MEKIAYTAFFSQQLNHELLAYQSNFTDLITQEDASTQQQIAQYVQQLHAIAPSSH
ncbi:hypothetical protein [Acinetobacter rathckeae]|uniref:hypothetical protein n=1 Tax=Acinetobacter rathckeae TaxID=2605272 RepID=UPI001BB41352|nr:hypothetical protein [Acinetobacter rathckeae]MBF7688902.1 hypothetical protein [Acinetobacter rathckeae]